MKNKRILSLVLALLLLLTAAPAVLAENAAPRMVTVAESWEYTAGFYPVMTPAVSNNYGIMGISSNLYETLMCYDREGKLKGQLAESVDISDDGRVYTFKLRQGVKFSDGSPLTSEAVKKSLEAAVINLGPYNGSYGKITTLFKDMQTPDDLTFVLTLTQPYYAALHDLSVHNPLSITGLKAFEGGLDKAYENLKDVSLGTGPFMFDSFDGSTYTFVRNPHYWGDKPQLDGFRVKVIPDNDAKVLALRSGEIDMLIGAARLSFDAFLELAEDPGYGSAISWQNTNTHYLGMNLKAQPFDDRLVRQAVAYAIDQEVLETTVFGGLEKAAETLFHKSKPYCDVEQKEYPTDLDKANALLDEAGWLMNEGSGVREKNGEKLSFKLLYSQSLATIDNAMLAIAAQLKKIGMEVEPAGMDMMSWYGEVMAGNYTMVFWQTYGTSYEPYSVVTNMDPAASTDPIAAQFAAFLPGGAALIEEVNSTTDDDRVQAIYTQILQTIQDECLLVPIAYVHETALWNLDLVDSFDFGSTTTLMNIPGVKLK